MGRYLVKRLAHLSLILMAVLVTAAKAHSPDPAHGLEIAKRWCASCHVVSPDQKRASADVPTFAAIARSPTFDRRSLAFFLLDPHPKMPDLPLTRSAADDIAAYIESLAK
jgi:mono/diheme cytochrome c family protein